MDGGSQTLKFTLPVPSRSSNWSLWEMHKLCKHRFCLKNPLLILKQCTFSSGLNFNWQHSDFSLLYVEQSLWLQLKEIIIGAFSNARAVKDLTGKFRIRKKTFMSQNLCFAWKENISEKKSKETRTSWFSDRNNMQVCQEIGNNNNLRYWSGLFHCCNQICVCMYPAKGGRGAMFCCICDVNHIPRHINHPDVPVMSRCRYLCPLLMDLSLFVSTVISI